MRVFKNGFVVAVALLGVAGPAYSQKATEQYIPIGQSPGLSGKLTYLGAITQISATSQTITVRDTSAPLAVRMSKATRIWLDRSKLKQTNISGTWADLKPGRRVEVKFVDPKRRDVAEWVKVEITQE